MTIYQEEMQRRAHRYECTTGYNEETQTLDIAYKGVPLAGITDKGFMHYSSKDLTDPETREVYMHLVDDVQTVREYVGLYCSSVILPTECDAIIALSSQI